MRLDMAGLALAAAIMGGCGELIHAVHADGCDYRDTLAGSESAAGASRVHVIGRAGDLEIRGASGASQIEARAGACASSQASLDDMRLIVERRGSEIWVEARVSDGLTWKDQRRMDLVVDLPSGVKLVVEDSSGDLTIRDVGQLDLDDSSGDARIEGVSGSLTVEDSSGGLDIRRVKGDVDVEDSSGEIRITEIDGNVRVRDGSGGIRVTEVRGDFVLERDGSGGVDYSGISGRVDLPEGRRHRRR